MLALIDGQTHILNLAKHVKKIAQGDFMTIDNDGCAVQAVQGDIVKAISFNDYNAKDLYFGIPRIVVVVMGKVWTSNFNKELQYKPLDRIYIEQAIGDVGPTFTNRSDCRPDTLCGYVTEGILKEDDGQTLLGVYFSPFMNPYGVRF
jgi:hypothetical protein